MIVNKKRYKAVWQRACKLLIRLAIIVAISFVTFIVADYLAPLPANNKKFSTVVVADNGAPLRVFPDKKGVWRYPVTIEDVSPRYIQALLGYEDRWFYYHPGVNPLAMVRAVGQLVWHGKPISGGSTITMQVARLLDPHSKDMSGKLKQMFRALQLEWHFSKTEILNIYLNIAPFGGTVEGIQAACYNYLGKSSKQLTYAEAALMAVLPQSPSRFRPDRHPQRAEKARNKVLKRLAKFEIWEKEAIQEAFDEHVAPRKVVRPQYAALLAERLVRKSSNSNSGENTASKIETHIDINLQSSIEDLLRSYTSALPSKTSAAVLVVENKNMKVRAYAGSAAYSDNSRYGYIDMVRAMRSPGSTLKPFLYGLAMDDALIHSASLLQDVPLNFDGYKPQNFLGGFYGPVTVSDALQRSLNIPAVQVLSHYGESRFVNSLRNALMKLKIPGDAKPNLAVILGGAATNLESLVGAYSALANSGMADKIKIAKNNAPQSKSSTNNKRRLLSSESAWIIKNILEENERPSINSDVLFNSRSRKVAWKTGTSYGHRDSWAIGVTENYTIGIWIGRPDSTPIPGHYGAVTAAPLLFNIVDSFNLSPYWADSTIKPKSVSQKPICWPLGLVKNGNNDPLCHKEHQAWVINETTPVTLRESKSKLTANVEQVMLSNFTGKRINLSCSNDSYQVKPYPIWPTGVIPWLDYDLRKKAIPPKPDENCLGIENLYDSNISISGIEHNTIIKKIPNSENEPVIALHATGTESEVYWMVDQKLMKRLPNQSPFMLSLSNLGEYNIFALDESGNMDHVRVVYQ